MSPNMEAKIHIGGYSKIKERTLGKYGGSMRLNCHVKAGGK